MHLRRALLLFAIVLALAAVAASVSRPREDSGERTESASPPPADHDEPPALSPGPAVDAATAEVTFDVTKDQTRRLPTGSASVAVEVDEPGEVEIPGLGLSAAADPLTPALFEIFSSTGASHEISFTPADGNESRAAGTLVVEPPPE